MAIQNMSQVYRVNKIDHNQLDQVFDLCLSNPQYYDYTKSTLTMASIEKNLMALPPDKTLEDKYFLGFYEADQLVAILDLIKGYPNSETAYIGLFMTHKKVQGRGKGAFIINEVEQALALEGFKYVKLAFIVENKEAEAFWIKSGYKVSGELINMADYNVLPMMKTLV